MNPAICWGKRIIATTTTNAAQRSTLPSNLPRTAHCLARCCCQNPRPSNTTARPKSQGRNVVKKALAAPAPRAAANPSGRQQLIIATELRIATNEAVMPVPVFTICPLGAPPALLGESLPRVGDRLVSIPDTNGNSAQSSAPSAARTSLTSFTAAGRDGHSATYKTSTFTWYPPVSLGFLLSKPDNDQTA